MSDFWHIAIMDIKRTFKVCGCTESQKILYANYLLQGEAVLWWGTKRQLITMEFEAMEEISQERFKKEFDNWYFPALVSQYKSKDFASFVQGNMTVEQYFSRFMELGRFTPHLISIESMRTKRFQDGLQAQIRSQVVCLEIKGFQKLVHVASIASLEQRNSLIARV